jgi:hypothetical protein
MKRLALHLIGHGLDHFRIAVTDVEDAEAAQAIYVLFAIDVTVRIRSGVRPLDGCSGVLDRRRFAVFQEARIDVVAEGFDGFAGDPRNVVRRDLRLCDEF